MIAESESIVRDAFGRLNERYSRSVETAMRGVVGARGPGPRRLMRYHLGWEDASGRRSRVSGGKMLRPTLCLLSCEAAGGAWRLAVPAAASLELLHNFTLIHDDVEDASSLRHGRPAVWRVWGKEQAINVGDGMFAIAHIAMLQLQESGQPPARIVTAIQILDETTLKLCEGQHLDLAQNSRARLTRAAYLKMIEGKSAALISASAALGALLGGASAQAIDRFAEYGRRLGLAFQIRDDMLGIWGRDAVTGKSAADDLRAGKQTFPIIAARARAKPSERRAMDALLRDAANDRSAARAARAELERLGAREASERAARTEADAAIECLPKRGLIPARARELELLARFAADRES